LIHLQARVAILALVVAGAAHGGTREGVDAYAANDFERAMKELAPEADRGDPVAQYFLALLYLAGQGVPIDKARAVRLWRSSAESGFVHSQAMLAMALFKGEGTPRDLSEAVVWYARAAEQGDPPSQLQYGRALMFGAGGRPPEPSAGAVWVRRAAEAGDAEAQNFLAAMYQQGNGVPKDWQQAYFWSLLASADGDPAKARLRNLVEQTLSPDERRRAQAAARDWRPSGSAPPPPERAAVKPAAPTLTMGSAFAITPRRLVTSHHVVDDCSNIRVGGKYRGTVAHRDKRNDLALVEVDQVLPDVATVRTSRPRLGETVTAVGFPLQGVLAGISATTGNISSLAGLGGDSRFLAFTAPIQQGNSGGPLLDSSGRIAGVVVSKLNAVRMAAATGDVPQNVNFAIAANVLAAFLDSASIDYAASPASAPSDPEAIVSAAQTFTFLVECAK
jgi:S1-C subfamily serine protease